MFETWFALGHDDDTHTDFRTSGLSVTIRLIRGKV